ncbi:MAG: tyrosine recombinase XerC [Nostoc sp. EfeVER01]|uniref:site-specific integrase n=1 Tax=unclassified Nostoc TaxID=2593658 RepID=UPI002AD1ECA0|nr:MULTISPECIES: site-specific integrase [unclassified Nostoc]MDZ7943516.1 site-specific integrase [Nostoc sp. EfeVER01]MDZ7990987.1 site-specific integrase [Nostoc sp. EspVER01]
MREITPRNNKGSIIIRFTFGGKEYCFSPIPGSKYSDKLALAKAEEIANRIRQDCIAGYFDSTLTKYKPNAMQGRTKEAAIQDAQEAREIVAARLSVNAVDLLQLFEDYTQFKSKTLKSNSMIDYDRIKNKLKKCPHKLARDAVQIMQWLVQDHQGTSTSSIEKQWKLINAACKWGVACQKLQSNTFDGLRSLIPSTKKSATQDDINPFSDNERKHIIQAFYASSSYSYYAPLVEFLFITGCRPEEALALQWKHIKGGKITFCQKLTANGEVEVGTKTQSKRSITVNDRIASVVNEIKPEKYSPDDFVFPAKKGGFIDWHNFANRAWKSVLKSLPDIEYRNPYQMRHTAITTMVRSGVDSVVVAKWVGNSPNMIAKRYLGDVSDVMMPNS